MSISKNTKLMRFVTKQNKIMKRKQADLNFYKNVIPFINLSTNPNSTINNHTVWGIKCPFTLMDELQNQIVRVYICLFLISLILSSLYLHCNITYSRSSMIWFFFNRSKFSLNEAILQWRTKMSGVRVEIFLFIVRKTHGNACTDYFLKV